ncbi:hypothetical protein OUZ56_008647 [Daphnia magna]|uniref:Uncharacterized protein n=1 Tax=Daphnia magna TaxID=35525 RepID=A0ABR0ADM1_9CRUS|nr:hypothetical protein OUZ56_008647 [Daphnia magna]
MYDMTTTSQKKADALLARRHPQPAETCRRGVQLRPLMRHVHNIWRLDGNRRNICNMALSISEDQFFFSSSLNVGVCWHASR